MERGATRAEVTARRRVLVQALRGLAALEKLEAHRLERFAERYRRAVELVQQASDELERAKGSAPSSPLYEMAKVDTLRGDPEALRENADDWLREADELTQ